MSETWRRLSVPLMVIILAITGLVLLLNNLTVASARSSESTPAIQGPVSPADLTAEIATNDLLFTGFHSDQVLPTSKDEPQIATYIVVMEESGLARYSGDIAGLAGTSLQATGADKIDATSADSVQYLDYLADRRADVISSINATLGRELDVAYEYGATMVGFAAQMTAAEAAQIEARDDVAFVQIETISYPQTDAGPAWSGAPDVWGGEWNALNYEVSMSGTNEVPSVTTNVTGSGVFTYNFFTNLLEYDITITNPDNVQLTAMHIHSGTAGTNGGVIYNFAIASTTSGLVTAGSTTLTDEAETSLVNDGLYVNLHSTNNPAGEARGQIDLSGSLGEGIVVGIIDTGIDPWNPSFAAVGGDGYVHTNPKGSGNYLGVCDPANAGSSSVVAYDATFPCNDKLIGVWGFTASDTTPRDRDGHGSHTAGTSAGNIVFDSVIESPTQNFTATVISGVAPHANIIAYDGCTDGGGCPGAALAAARDQALLDGVDVINYSIGSSAPTGAMWSNAEALQWLALRDAGIFVATSNGNAGNEDATTGSPADLPWITSVGANSHNRAFLVTVVMTDTTNQTATVSGQALSAGYGPAEIVFSTVYSTSENARLCAPGTFPPGTFNGEIVICERGTYGRVAKGQAVLDGGAGGFILAQPEAATGGPGAVSADNHALPAAHIDYNNYQILRQFLLTDSIGTVSASLSGTVLDVDNSHGDVMASFSSRGPNRSEADLIVPNITAPGRAIWAAYNQGSGGDGDFTYNSLQGTSMSSPHVAGAGALLAALHPDWTPSEIESALMMTARNTVLDDDGTTVATPFAQGSGHIQIGMAADSPLVMNVTKAEYEAADPSEDNGFDVRDLNIASLGENQCVGTCSWERTVENVSSETLTWTLSADTPISVSAMISPSMFSLAPGQKQLITVTVDVSAATIDEEWRFGTINLDETGGDYPDAHWPFAIIPSAGNIPETVSIETQTTSGTYTMTELVSIDAPNLHFDVTGLYKGDRTDLTVVQDANRSANFPDIFFDDTTTQFISMTVPTDSFSAIAEIVSTSSADLDMLLFLDVDSDGPELSDVGDPATNPNACQSASSGNSEFCEILSPTAGTYYVAVLNYTQVKSGGDTVDLATAVIPNGTADQGNLVVNGPGSVSNNELYTLTLDYDDSSMTAIEKMYGYFTVGSSPSNAGDIGTVRVFLDYLGIPTIEIDPTTISKTLEKNTTSPETLLISATNGVLDWNVTTFNGDEAVKDGSFEEGYATNPYWRGEASAAGSILPICSPSTCGVNLATNGSWFVWFGGVAGIQSAIEQTVTIPANDMASLSFNMIMGTISPTVATATLNVFIDNTIVGTYTEADLASFSGYNKATIDVSPYADGSEHLLRMEFSNSPAQNFNTFIDEVSLVSFPSSAATCNIISSISWLSASPGSGSVVPDESGSVALTFNAAGLDAGTYTDTLCVNSNDPVDPVINVPITMEVFVLPTPALSATVNSVAGARDSTVTHTVSISNSGTTTGTFDINLSGNSWSSVSSLSSVTLGVGESQTFTVSVTIPPTADFVSSDTVTITAVDQGPGARSDQLILYTRTPIYRDFWPAIFN